jgi:hypothetical protein
MWSSCGGLPISAPGCFLQPGLSIARIRKITGLTATTIMRILNKPPKPRA